MLQTKRIKYYRNETDPTCLLCGAAEENVLHFILQCEKLQSERAALLFEINAIWQNEFQNNENFERSWPTTTANGQYNQGETYQEKLSQRSQTRRSIKEINIQIAY
jgi:hypothetical protein